MQIPDEVRQCVVFLGFDTGADDPEVCGTAFFVAWPSEDPVLTATKGFCYLVTAKHVIDGIAASSLDGRIYVRANLVGREATWVSSEREAWRFPAEDAAEYVDVAILPWLPDPAVVEYKALPRAMFATQSVINTERIGLGDELFITGLFVNHYGQRRNSPIVRVGNIAGMPDEPVRTNLGRMSAYLVEARSLGGLSGSPAFVSVGPTRVGSDGGVAIGAGMRFFLLGLMRGHWDADLSGAEDVALDGHLSRELVNMGVAVVVPAQTIGGVLDQPDVKQERDDLERGWRNLLPNAARGEGVR